ncbi:glucan biosynthesis protein [Pelagibius marinus]|uniref:glucan biosynthesis protein n=1 Tax=Pelagibius marinus TaxID=2762760 RepID=UPI0018721F38|nr:glucan biosynthesis protein D [Pelagibius marinus]
MPRPFSRRRLLELASLGAAVGAAGPALLGPLESWAQGGGLHFGPARPFSFEALTQRARETAGRAYQPPYRPAPQVVEQIDYEAHGKIRFDPDRALYGPESGGPKSAYPATFFHLGRFFGKSVKMHALASGPGGMEAREILYSPDYFEMPADSIARRLPEDSGFAGFRLQESIGRDAGKSQDWWRSHDWIAFLGASYFRAIGELEQYGLSARGVVVNPTLSGPEEFPDFTEFYIAPAEKAGDPVAVYALLDGPSLAGAYRFSLTRGAGVIMEVEKHLFLRRDVARLGLAPLTSMYFYSEGDRPARMDWRPEIHDSDGLALWTGGGERLWRSLNNPEQVTLSSFFDDNPRGFGLLQRDRDFDHYLDGVHYERRSSLWVEPLGDWGPGSVQLLEIPTDDEIHDNIVACWVAQAAAKAGDSRHLTYRLHWLAEEPYPARDFARVTATRLGRGGQPGKPRPPGLTKFVVDFEGGRLPGLNGKSEPEPVVTASRGEVSRVFAEPVPGTKAWRAVFDLAVEGEEPVELRMYLALGKEPLSETWLYQFRPARGPRS